MDVLEQLKIFIGFIIFSYNQLSSDFNNEIVREARGIIFKNGEWEHPVCHAFDKFGNYGETYVPDLDWDTTKVSEKIDGSIMKLWCCDGRWHLSTNSNIDAINSDIGDVRKDNFGELFWEICRKYLPSIYGATDYTGWLKTLNQDCTYIFELVSPYTRVVIPYEESNIYFLGARNNISNKQFGCDAASALMLGCGMFPRPKIYALSDLESVITAAENLSWNEEGYVCYDKDFNRCKIKSPKYVVAHFARNNNVITRWHLIDIILKGEMNEFIIYASDYKDQIEYVKDLMDKFIEAMDGAGYLARGLRKLDRPAAAEIIKNFDKVAQSIMFMNYDKDVSGEDYVVGWDTYKWDRILTQYEEFKKRYGE